MWDVIWTDPDKELVGEHRARKERKRGPKSEASSKDHPHTSSRNSFSTRSSVSSSDAALSYLRSQQRIKKGKAKGKEQTDRVTAEGKSSWRSASWSKASSTASSALASLSITSARSPLSPTFDIRSRRSSGLATTNESSLHSRPSIASRTTKETEDSVLDEQAPDQGRQHINPAETLVSNTNDEAAPEKALFGTVRDLPATRSDGAQVYPQISDRTDATMTKGALMAKLNSTSLTHSTKELALDSRSPSEPCDPPPAVPPKSPLRPTSQPCPPIVIPGNGGGWMSADEWSQRALSHDSDTEDPAWIESKILDLTELVEEQGEMTAATPEAILSRLRGFPEKDHTAHQDLERKRWLICALQHLDPSSSLLSSDDTSIGSSQITQEALILFESCNTAAYIAAQYPKMNLYHVARHPLRNATFANIIPLSLPSLSAQIFAHALPLDLDLIYSNSLSSLCPAPSLTRTLACLRSHLRPNGGALHLTLIDALPHPATLGPHLQRWLERNLIVNLPPHSLSHTPTRLFPKCLAAASLRGPGSRRVKTKFFASSASIRGSAVSEEDQQHEDHDPDPAIRRLRTELRVKAELRCLVGRMLWRDVWGPYVSPCVGDNDPEDKGIDGNGKDEVSWWWDDEACMAECLQLGTFWEYHTIEAVRGS